MTILPETKLPTIEAIYNTYKNTPPRPHLGASLIGRECLRQLWYTFRWCTLPTFEPRMLRLFGTGFIEEGRIIDDLRNAGIVVFDRDPETGKQWSFKEFGGHFSGSADGVIQGIKESAKPHLLECKTANDKSFKDLVKKGVKLAKPEHHDQMIVYMDKFNLERAYYICVNKNSDEIFGERLHADKSRAAILNAKAKTIVFSPTPIDKQGDSEKSMCCKWCDYAGLCWHGKLPEPTCRSCAHSSAEPDGTWSCVKRSHPLSVNEQLHGCPQHIYIPQLTPWDVVDADPDAGTITYSNGVVNGPGGKSSGELKNATN